jgi:hypothetical protein
LRPGVRPTVPARRVPPRCGRSTPRTFLLRVFRGADGQRPFVITATSPDKTAPGN